MDEQFFMDAARSRRKKKVDTEALNSSLMRVPRMKVEVARDLIDLGIREIYELQGRSPEALFDELKTKRRIDVPPERLAHFRMATYYAETDAPDPALLRPEAWL